ncbi:MAG: peptidoglycan-associated lipoprotein Pal [Candidatus Latescibacteria bacterium]|nr:peptidoglycan-associated lipoprotein Pal [Candidatus Latescibacterota bacterium]
MYKKGNVAVVFVLGLLLTLASFNGCAKKKAETPPPKPAPVVQEKKPAPKPQVKEPERKIVEKVAISESQFNTVYFDFDKSDIKSDQRSNLSNNARLLSDNSTIRIRIEGHCDERGTDEYNMALGQRRADAIKQYLIDYGISSSRISTISYGEERPVSSGHNESSWSQNRRGEFKITSQ